VALHLARRGHSVVGVDDSPQMLARCRAALDGETRDRVRLVEADVRAFDLGEAFELVLCAFGSFEQLLTADDQVRALACAARHLSPEGVFVAELRALTAIDWSGDPGTLVHDWTRRDPATGDLVTKLRSTSAAAARQVTLDTIIFDRVGADGVVRRRVLDVTLRAIGRHEIELLLTRAGMRLLHVYGAHDLSPYEDASDTMIVVAGRAG
jgi:SAM-dependent methyltransferase